MNDLICAIATPRGSAGVSIIRLSGNGAAEFISKYTKTDKVLNNKFNTIFLEDIYFDNKFYDQVLISKFEKGKSFTGDEVVEINCHGGSYNTNLLLSNILKDEEIRLAENGEFTKRAFINGKISLNKAQGVMDLINSHNEQTRKMAINSFNDNNIEQLNNIYDKFMEVSTLISVGIDYPEYQDIESVEYNNLIESLSKINVQLNEILVNTNRGLIIKEGIKTSIIGQPNVGKSTLMNLLSNKNKAIVTDIKGTTRDIIESEIQLNDLKLILFDTAGIRELDEADQIEKIGINLSIEQIDKSELIIFVVDSNTDNVEKDLEIYEMIKNKKHIILNNKVDIGNKKVFSDSVDVSLNDKTSLDKISNLISNLYQLNEFDADNDFYLNNYEHKNKLEQIINITENSINNLSDAAPIDFIEIDLKEALFILGDILGYESKDDLISEMFSKFCLGK